MKITIDLDKADISYQFFVNRAQWDEFMYQYRPNRGFYNPEPRDRYPVYFPCAMLSTPSDIIGRPDGNDEYWNTFLYNGTYSVEEDPVNEDVA